MEFWIWRALWLELQFIWETVRVGFIRESVRGPEGTAQSPLLQRRLLQLVKWNTRSRQEVPPEGCPGKPGALREYQEGRRPAEAEKGFRLPSFHEKVRPTL